MMSASQPANDVTLPFESYGVSHPGCVRDENEDNYLIEPRSGLWVVADGMGGHEAGRFASETIVNHLATIGVARSAPELRAHFEDRLVKAHDEIRELSRRRGTTIGSTVAALLAMDGRFACLWSGDSRVYLIRDGVISQLSRDHTEVQDLLDRGMITPAEASTWPRRNVITRAVGRSHRPCQRRGDRGGRQQRRSPGRVRTAASDGAEKRRDGQRDGRRRTRPGRGMNGFLKGRIP
jgi:serine/threonine protein phosphatase PrpC